MSGGGQPPLNAAWAGDGGRYGARLLSRMGWKGSGAGLGAREDGTAEHIAVKRRPAGAALGADVSAGPGNAALASAVQDFNAVLRAVAADAAATFAAASEPPADEDGARAAKRRRRAERKAAAAAAAAAEADEADEAGETAAGGAESGEAEAAAAAAAAAAVPVAPPAAARVAARGRYGKSARHKAVERYSAADLAAILGGGAL
jgi:hypothetical protein